MVDSCQSWILPVAAAVLAIHHRGLWREAVPFFFVVTQSLSVVLFLGLFQLFFLSRSMVPVFFQSVPAQLVLAVVIIICCMGGAVVLLGSAAVKLTQ